MNEMRIKKVENGYLLSIPREEEDGDIVVDQEVIEIIDPKDKEEYGTLDEDKVALSRLFERIAMEFGEDYDKWSKENLSVRWDKEGHKTE